jgi:hypothetical protein
LPQNNKGVRRLAPSAKPPPPPLQPLARGLLYVNHV